jgi:hypothetical protein
MNAIIERHELVRQLLDNGWLHLFQMDEHGRIAQRYDGALRWTSVDQRREGSVTSIVPRRRNVEAVA